MRILEMGSVVVNILKPKILLMENRFVFWERFRIVFIIKGLKNVKNVGMGLI